MLTWRRRAQRLSEIGALSQKHAYIYFGSLMAFLVDSKVMHKGKSIRGERNQEVTNRIPTLEDRKADRKKKYFNPPAPLHQAYFGRFSPLSLLCLQIMRTPISKRIYCASLDNRLTRTKGSCTIAESLSQPPSGHVQILR